MEDDMLAEAYSKDDLAIIVHFREGGYVYYHVQRKIDGYIPYTNFHRMKADQFQAQVKELDDYDPTKLHWL